MTRNLVEHGDGEKLRQCRECGEITEKWSIFEMDNNAAEYWESKLHWCGPQNCFYSFGIRYRITFPECGHQEETVWGMFS